MGPGKLGVCLSIRLSGSLTTARSTSRASPSPSMRPRPNWLEAAGLPRGNTTKPFMSSLRLTVSRRSSGTFRRIDLAGVVAAAGADEFEPWEADADLFRTRRRAVAILHARRMDHDPHG